MLNINEYRFILSSNHLRNVFKIYKLDILVEISVLEKNLGNFVFPIKERKKEKNSGYRKNILFQKFQNIVILQKKMSAF